jgi:hypothetical protein
VGAALTVIGRPVVAGRRAAEHSIFRSRRIFLARRQQAHQRLALAVWQGTFLLLREPVGLFAACIASAARGPKHGHARGEHLGGCFRAVSGCYGWWAYRLLHRMSCTMVRYYVALYSATAAEQYARGKGATADIEVARHCIKPEVAAQTASAQLAR